MSTLTIDDGIIAREVTVAQGATVLHAVRQEGVHLPTLCHWEGLPPYGACRLCVVVVRQPARGPEGQVVAACTHPATDGLVVETRAPEAVAVRRMMLEFLLARCPTSGVIRHLAAGEGITASRFEGESLNPDELCVLCGLCVRVCRDLVGAAAISFTGRGGEREVAAPFHVQAEACIGCGACAAVCPTGAVRIEDIAGERHLVTWNTVVPLKPCPGCGRPFAPEPMAFLTGLAEASEHLWGLCPACRRKEAGRAVGQARAAAGRAT